jgi:predicted Rossmann fold nucleotide-binding protein DprA/Smf involved in DNA uptake
MRLAARLATAQLTPGVLLGMSAESIGAALDLEPNVAGRFAGLLQRAAPVTIELERLIDRGIWVLTPFDSDYPEDLRSRLADESPPVLFGAGEPPLLSNGGLAVVGSRDVDEDGARFAAAVASAAGRGGTQVVSGAARGVDVIAMQAAFEAGGTVVGVPADALDRRIREPETRAALSDGFLALTTPYLPSKGFTVGTAMGRNKVIYGLAQFALVVSAADGEGGTWAGAVEALDRRTTPVFVRDDPTAPSGNRRLIERGAVAFHISSKRLQIGDLEAALTASPVRPNESPAAEEQQTLFGQEESRPRSRSKPRKRRATT